MRVLVIVEKTSDARVRQNGLEGGPIGALGVNDNASTPAQALEFQNGQRALIEYGFETVGAACPGEVLALAKVAELRTGRSERLLHLLERRAALELLRMRETFAVGSGGGNFAVGIFGHRAREERLNLLLPRLGRSR